MCGFVYILLSQKDGHTYVGSTDNLSRRINEHNSGRVIATKNRKPLKLIYSEEYPTIEQARQRERYLKSTTGRRYIKQKIFE